MVLAVFARRVGGSDGRARRDRTGGAHPAAQPAHTRSACRSTSSPHAPTSARPPSAGSRPASGRSASTSCCRWPRPSRSTSTRCSTCAATTTWSSARRRARSGERTTWMLSRPTGSTIAIKMRLEPTAHDRRAAGPSRSRLVLRHRGSGALVARRPRDRRRDRRGRRVRHHDAARHRRHRRPGRAHHDLRPRRPARPRPSPNPLRRCRSQERSTRPHALVRSATGTEGGLSWVHCVASCWSPDLLGSPCPSASSWPPTRSRLMSSSRSTSRAAATTRRSRSSTAPAPRSTWRRWLQRPDVLQRQRVGRAHDQPHRHRRRRRRLRRRPVLGRTPTILAQADQTNGAGWFNGDDAVVLRKGDDRPRRRSGRSASILAPSGAPASPARPTTRSAARPRSAPATRTAADVFDPSIEWDGFATDTFDGLGTHSDTVRRPTPHRTVASDQPGNGATDVAVERERLVTFSEPVTVVGACVLDLRAPRAAPMRSSPSAADRRRSRSTRPSTSRSARRARSRSWPQVSDQDVDDPPDTMAGDFVVTFTTVGARGARSTRSRAPRTSRRSTAQAVSTCRHRHGRRLERLLPPGSEPPTATPRRRRGSSSSPVVGADGRASGDAVLVSGTRHASSGPAAAAART